VLDGITPETGGSGREAGLTRTARPLILVKDGDGGTIDLPIQDRGSWLVPESFQYYPRAAVLANVNTQWYPLVVVTAQQNQGKGGVSIMAEGIWATAACSRFQGPGEWCAEMCARCPTSNAARCWPVSGWVSLGPVVNRVVNLRGLLCDRRGFVEFQSTHSKVWSNQSVVFADPGPPLPAFSPASWR